MFDRRRSMYTHLSFLDEVSCAHCRALAELTRLQARLARRRARWRRRQSGPAEEHVEAAARQRGEGGDPSAGVA